jgi:hypothetical protein
MHALIEINLTVEKKTDQDQYGKNAQPDVEIHDRSCAGFAKRISASRTLRNTGTISGRYFSA